MQSYRLSHPPLKRPKPLVRTRSRNLRPLLALAFLITGIFITLYSQDSQAAANYADATQDRSSSIARSIQEHEVDTPVEDLWHLLPVTAQRDEVTAKYVQQDAATVIAGIADRAEEQQPKKTEKTVVNDDDYKSSSESGLRAVDPERLVNRTCSGGRTILQVIAHADDDLLFMNPDLLQAIQRGDCVRTVYITAGDAGSDESYWLGRERGSQAAYSLMSGTDGEWSAQNLKLANRKYISAVNQVSNDKLSLLYMHLPDGNPDGQGFANSSYESVGKLVNGENISIQSVDEQSEYSRKDLIDALRAIMEVYKPDEVRTLRSTPEVAEINDHSDHLTVGQLASEAFEAYAGRHPEASMEQYSGYPVLSYPANVSGEELAMKEAAFFMYARHDGAVCGSVEACAASGNYWHYLQRQYRNSQ